MAGRPEIETDASTTDDRPPGGGQPDSRGWITGAAILLVAAIFIVYAPALRGRFIWDDDAHVTKPELRSAHQVHVMAEGRMVESGPPRRIFESPSQPRTREFFSEAVN